MKAFAAYLASWFRIESAGRLALSILFVAVLITLNYTVGIEKRLFLPGPAALSIPGFALFYLFVLVTGWMIQFPRGLAEVAADASSPLVSDARPPLVSDARSPLAGDARSSLVAVLLLAPLYFACKMVHWDLSWLVPAGCGGSAGRHYPWDRYTQVVLQWPAKLLLLALILAIWRRVGPWRGVGGDGPLSFGLTTRGFSAGPYLAILAMLVPLIVLASTQHDFLRAYPKLRNAGFINGYANPLWPWRLLYEISYGLDFVTIELFFRGLLVVWLSRWLGPKVVLPMAIFYCSIHFGKPLGECISSFAGGLALGVLAWRTRSILGGLMVHLGIAWMMEIGGWVGNGW
jgi:CAAX prenyl protease-like protein